MRLLTVRDGGRTLYLRADYGSSGLVYYGIRLLHAILLLVGGDLLRLLLDNTIFVAQLGQQRRNPGISGLELGV